jgi:tetratricopeptide (TPR) repeat protein
MSLLLDALKKAADDKEKSSRGELPEKQVTKPKIVAVGYPSTANEHPPQQNTDRPPAVKIETANSQEDKRQVNMQHLAARLSNKTIDIPESLTLDIDHDTNEELSLTDDVANESEDRLTVAPDKAGNYETEHEVAKREDVSLDEAMAAAAETTADDKHSNHVSEERSAVSKLTVSDDALSLLINKTNREEKRRKVIVTGSVLFISLLILLSGGLYYYTDMQEEIAAMERKHQIAMQQMRAKTNNEQTPEKTAIIRNLVSDTKLEEKVQYAKEQVAKTKKSAPASRQRTREANDQIRSATTDTAGGTTFGAADGTESKNQISSGDLAIRKTNKSDPVGVNLDAAWLAYERGNYSDAKQLYRNVLKIEDGNRDAQLGLGAIAVIEKDNVRARRIYSALLQQDPRDPIATAALAGLNSHKDSLVSDNSYLLAMLEKNPDAPHLNFSVGNNYAQQKKWKSAQQYYFKAWQYDSDNADYLFNLAVSMDQLGKSQQAIDFYRDSLVKSSNKQVGFSVAAVQKRIDELSGL